MGGDDDRESSFCRVNRGYSKVKREYVAVERDKVTLKVASQVTSYKLRHRVYHWRLCFFEKKDKVDAYFLLASVYAIPRDACGQREA